MVVNKKVIFFIVLFLIVLAVGIWWFSNKPPTPADIAKENDKNVTTNGSYKQSTDSDFPLNKGSKGKWVKNTQKNINLANKKRGKTTKISEDGDFGSGTEFALVELGKFLGYNNLKILDAAHYNGIRNYILTGSILNNGSKGTVSDTSFSNSFFNF